MKRFFLAGTLLLTASFLQAATPERKDAVFVGYSSTGLTTSTSVIVVDISDTVNFPHKRSGAASVFGLRADIAKATTSTGTLKVGVVTRVDATNGDVTWFWTKDFSTDGSGAITENVVLPQTQIRTEVRGRRTPFMVATSSAASNVFQTDVLLPTVVGNVAPGVGDIVAQLVNLGSGALNFSVNLLYETEQ